MTLTPSGRRERSKAAVAGVILLLAVVMGALTLLDGVVGVVAGMVFGAILATAIYVQPDFNGVEHVRDECTEVEDRDINAEGDHNHLYHAMRIAYLENTILGREKAEGIREDFANRCRW